MRKCRGCALFLWMAACHFGPGDYSGTAYECGPTGSCPPSFVCSEGVCVDPADVADASDAATVDGAPGPEYSAVVMASEPVGYYRLGEPIAAAIALDASGRGNAGTYENSPELEVPGAIEADPDTCLRLDGDNVVQRHVALPILMSSPEDWTFELWVYVETRAGGGSEYEGLVGEVNNPRITWDNPAKKLTVGTQFDDTTWAGGPQLMLSELDRWVHVAAVWRNASSDSPSAELYVDGQLMGSTSFGKPIRKPSQGLFIGRRDTSVLFVGRVDEVAFYDRALEADEIAAHFLAATE